MSEAIKPKCCGQVWPAGACRSYPCGKNASMEHEGKHYCKTHHPPTAQAKRDASHAKWQAQWDAQCVREQAARDADAEKKRRADAYEQLVERVKELEGALQAVLRSFPTDRDMRDAGWERAEIDLACRDYEAARAAISKALPNVAGNQKGLTWTAQAEK